MLKTDHKSVDTYHKVQKVFYGRALCTYLHISINRLFERKQQGRMVTSRVVCNVEKKLKYNVLQSNIHRTVPIFHTPGTDFDFDAFDAIDSNHMPIMLLTIQISKRAF